MFEIMEKNSQEAVIKVIGVGGVVYKRQDVG